MTHLSCWAQQENHFFKVFIVESLLHTYLQIWQQGCQMVCFQTKNPSLEKFLEDLAMENLGLFYDRLVYFTAIGNILWPFGIFCGHLVISPCLGILYQEKSGNPVWQSKNAVQHLRKFNVMINKSSHLLCSWA
jgi:hypothetical protein